MSRTVTMAEYGCFSVSDDRDGVIATTILLALGAPDVHRAIAHDGEGVSTQAIGSFERVHSRHELPEPFNEDPGYDPETQELWFLYREWDRTHRGTASTVLRGDELRALVAQALELRARVTVHVGFTGTRFGVTNLQLARMRDLLSALGPFVVVHHGDCIGADAQLHAIARARGWRVVVHPGPDGDNDRAGCDHDELRAPLTHMKRNKAIVVESHRVMAVPKHMTAQPYGGTWKTIEMTRKAKKPLVIVFPDGSVEGTW
jgi:hypothetical protein